MNQSDSHDQYIEQVLRSDRAKPLSTKSNTRMKEVMLLHFDQEFPATEKSTFFRSLGISLFGTLSMAVFIFMILRNKTLNLSQDPELDRIEMELEEFSIPEEDFSVDL